MRKQEGKCRFKPAPENTIEVNTKFPDVDLKEVDESSQKQMEKDFCEIVADAADEEPEACEATLRAGSVVVSAVLDLEERIGIMEGEKEGQNVDLVQEMDSLKVAVKNDLGKSSVKKQILTKAKNNKGMQEAAQGEITMTDVEAEMTAESATKAPTEAPEASSGDGSGDGTSEESSGNGADDGSSAAGNGADDDTPVASPIDGADDGDSQTPVNLSMQLSPVMFLQVLAVWWLW